MAPSSRFRSLLVAIRTWFLVRPIRIMILLYTTGIVWHLLHPIASILTGDFHHARRWYIDESSLDPSHFQMLMSYELIQNTKVTNKHKKQTSSVLIRSLCQGLLVQNSTTIPCYTHSSSTVDLEIVKVVPATSAGVSPVGEAIVIVVPPILEPFSLVESSSTSSKSQAQFHASLFQLIHRLTYTSPWLSKTVLFVAPRINKNTARNTFPRTDSLNPLLEATVTTFLDAYLGTTSTRTTPQQHPQERLPMELTGALLRTLLVVDVHIFTPSQPDLYPMTLAQAEDYEPTLPNEFRILPQGRHGVLPNMDLVFLVRTVYERSHLLAKQQLTVPVKHRYTMVQMASHIYTTSCTQLAQHLFALVEDSSPESVHDAVEEWLVAFVNLLAFEKTLAFGPYPPHAPALDRGLDALTIQGHFQASFDSDDYDPTFGNRPRTKQSPQEYPREQVQRLEFILRSLSNVHERLHHSTHLYLLLSPPHRFVKHEEYLVPNLLLVIPLLVRIASYLLLFVWGEENKESDKKNAVLNITDMAVSMIVVGAATWMFSWAVHTETFLGHGPKMMAMVFALLPVYLFSCASFLSSRSIQCAACMVATCMHVALAFGHVSLSFPSALVWTPLLAFPFFDTTGRRGRRSVVGIVFLLLACPSGVVKVVPRVFATYTPYMCYVYMPLYMWGALMFLGL